MRNEKGQFMKGNVHSDKWLSAVVGKTPWNKGTKGVMVGFWKGKKLTDEAKRKLSVAGKKRYANGYIPWNKGIKGSIKPNSTSFTKGQSPWNKGKKMPKYSGENHWNWKGVISSEAKKIWCSLEYRLWREAVFARDNYECQECGYDNGGILEAHHIKTQKKYPELRFNINNGITLCKECHKKKHLKISK